MTSSIEPLATPPVIQILGIPIHAITHDMAVHIGQEYLDAQPTQPRLIFTPNPEIVLTGYRQPRYAEILKQADLNVPDGHGLLWASRGQLPERVTGTDLLLQLLTRANVLRYTVGFVLDRNGLSSQSDVEQVMRTNYPQCTTVIWYGDDALSNASVHSSTVHSSAEAMPQLIFVALGSPTQEQWSVEHRHRYAHEQTGTKLIMAVGGGIDYLTGRQRRAPLFFRRRGLEWLWRLARQPKRLKRIWNAVIVFPYTVWRNRMAESIT